MQTACIKSCAPGYRRRKHRQRLLHPHRPAGGRPGRRIDPQHPHPQSNHHRAGHRAGRRLSPHGSAGQARPHNVIPASIVGLPEHSVENVTLENIRFTMPGSADPAVGHIPLDYLHTLPELPRRYPEFSMFGIATPATVQGRDFSALLGDPQQPFHEAAYSRFVSADAVVTDHFTYTSYDGGKSEMLYDLSKDPQENRNVAGDPNYAETIATMKELLKKRQAEAAK